LALALSFPAPARAEALPADEIAARVLTAEGYAAQAFEAYGRKHYAEAVALYEQAYATAPSADALFNIARIYDIGLRDRALAIAAYERCLSEPGSTPERLERVSERLLGLRRTERAVLESEHGPVPAGAAALPVQAPSASEPRPHSSALPTAALITGAAGVVGIGVGLGFGLSVLSDADTANAACNENRCTSQQGVAAAKSASTKATLATTGVSVGAALLVTGAVLWLLDGESEVEQPAPPGVRLTPVASASELGVALGGTW
jgi:tetratricopeptide (TPR) repeat protein